MVRWGIAGARDAGGFIGTIPWVVEQCLVNEIARTRKFGTSRYQLNGAGG